MLVKNAITSIIDDNDGEDDDDNDNDDDCQFFIKKKNKSVYKLSHLTGQNL